MESHSESVKSFFDDLPIAKAMHDVLAAKMLINPYMGEWELAKPIFVEGLKMSTQSTIMESEWAINSFKTLIGLRNEPQEPYDLNEQGFGYIPFLMW